MNEKIYDGDDKALEMGFADFESWLTQYPAKARGKGILARTSLEAWNGRVTDGPVLQAHVSGGRWLVTCWCGAHSYTSRRRPIHWCMSCGNGEISAAVPVQLPEELAEIERVLLLRPVQAGPNRGTQAAMQAIPLVPGLRRDWFPGQSVDWLMEINLANGVLS